MLRPIYNNDTSGPDVASKRVAIEEKYVGAIIGKGGSTIRNIQEQCNTRIHIEDKNPQGNGHRHLNITGNREAIGATQMMIQQIMGEAMNKHQQQGGQNHFGGVGGGAPQWGGGDNMHQSNNHSQSSSYNYQGSSYGAIGSNSGNNGNNNNGGGGGYQYY